MAALAARPRTATTTSQRPLPRRKKDHQRSDIWTNLLRQTRQAQAQSSQHHLHALQRRELVLLGGTSEDQRSFVEGHVSRPPAQRRDGREKQRGNGELRLSNRFAYGYGYVGLYSGSGAGLGGESEEVARVGVHCFPLPELDGKDESEGGREGGMGSYEDSLRRVLSPRKRLEEAHGEGDDQQEVDQGQNSRPSVVVLMSWHQPWTFLGQLRQWLQLLARALTTESSSPKIHPLDVLDPQTLNLTCVLTHTEAQATLERDSPGTYTEETFDHISQTLRTVLLPLGAGLAYIPSATPPQPPGGPLTELQKVIYTSLGLDISRLQAQSAKSSAAGGKAVEAKHNVVDRSAILVPAGWDSVGKIRLLSENFSPEAVQEGWTADMSMPVFRKIISSDANKQDEEISKDHEEADDGETHQANGGAEVFSSSHLPSPTEEDDRPLSPSKLPKSALTTYEAAIQDPHAHKTPQPPKIEVTTKPDQDFLAEMRDAMKEYELQDAEKAKREPASASNKPSRTSGGPSETTSGPALRGLGDVSFNVGGVEYDAEAAIARLKQPLSSHQTSSVVDSPQPTVSTPRTSTPRPPRRDGGSESSGLRDSGSTPGASGTKGGEMQMDKLEEYFHSLMKRGGGSGASTPSKAPQ